jgi:signal transduction histidine kinase
MELTWKPIGGVNMATDKKDSDKNAKSSFWDNLSHPRPYILITLILMGLFLVSYLYYFKSISDVYTNFFYLIIVFAGLWYQKRAIWIAIFLSALYLLEESLPPFSMTFSSVFRVLMFCLVAIVIGNITDRLVVLQNQLKAQFVLLQESHKSLGIANKSLGIANKKLNTLSSITRHDILNQLTGLDGYLTILKKKESDSILIDYIEKAKTVTKRISSLIQFTKQYENLGINTPIWQDCRTIVDTAVMHASLGQVIVKNDLSPGTEVYADSLLERVFYNLIENTLHYGGDQTKTIHISSQESDVNLTILYEDDGVGITAEDKMRLFTHGFGKHTGLGLFLSREILSITDITITENGTPGKGARFEILLPPEKYRMRKE